MKTANPLRNSFISFKANIAFLTSWIYSFARRQRPELKQVFASIAISAMMLPVFSLPVSAVTIRRDAAEVPGFGPVNEEVSVLGEFFRDAKIELEALTTPYRAANWSSNVSDPEKKSDGDKPKTDSKKKKTEETAKHADSSDLVTDRTIEPGEKSENEPAEHKNIAETIPEQPVAQPGPFFNQLPVDEQESVYTYENNLGAPPGQVEKDSSNQAAALRIRHRAGIANYSFGIPMASLSGRGINAGVGMTYNSRVWNKSTTLVNSVPTPHFTYDVEDSWIAPGFSSGLGYLQSKLVTRSVLMQDGGGYSNENLTEIIPEGIIEPDGTRRQILCTTWSQIPGGHVSARYCTSFQTSDGSRVKVSRAGSTYSIGGTVNYGNTRFTVRYSDGTTTEFTTPFGSGDSRKHYAVVFQDSNGNRNRVWYMSDQSGRISHIIDTLNRQIKFYYENDINGDPDKLVTVTIPGIGTSEELQTVRFYYDTLTLTSGGFDSSAQVTAPTTPIKILKYVYFPATKTGYKYDYHPYYGMITKITRLAGMTVSSTATSATGSVTSDGYEAASTEYDYPDGSVPQSDVPKYTKRTDDWAGNSTPVETDYDVPDPGPTDPTRISSISVNDGVRTLITETVSHNTGDWKNGLIKETLLKVDGPVFDAIITSTRYFWEQGAVTPGGRQNPRLAKIETTNDAGLTKATEFEYDGYDNQVQVKEYGYAAPESLGTLLRTTETAYKSSGGWIGKNMLSLPTSVKTIVSGTTVSKTLFEYDHESGNVADDSTLTPRPTIDTGTHSTYYNPAFPSWDEEICPLYDPDTQSSLPNGCIIIHHPGYDSSSSYRGNLTTVTAFSDATLTTDSDSDVKEINYDIVGNLVSATLSCCSLRTWEYDKANEFAFPVEEVSGSSPQLTKLTQYNRNTGLVIETENENGQLTTYEYETDTLRPKKVIYPNGGYVLTEYSDKLVTGADLVAPFIRQTATLDSTHTAQTYSYMDARGLGIRSAVQTADGWSISAAEYDHLGRMRKNYNPFYGSTPTATFPGGTKFTEVTAIDELGRTIEVTLQDDTEITTAFSTAGQIPSGFNKTFVTASDQAGKERRQVMDALGRIVRVDEPDVNGSLGAVDASLPAQQTSYEYDGNDNLAKVIQSDGTTTQERKFKYDSLSRLTHERQVEANPTLDIDGIKGTADPSKWTKVLKYNLYGLLAEGIDARGVKTTFSYDGLNRVSSVTYTGETDYQTPNVTYTYDQARTGFYNMGALTRVETAAVGDTPATVTELDYDLMGGVSKHRQWIAGQQYDLEYGYNLAGQMTSQKYPSGRVVTNSFDANGRLSGIADSSRSYVTGLQYQGLGGSVSQISFGNGTVQNLTLNDRFQMTGQELKKGSDVLQKYAYGYGQIDGSGNLDTTKNNGQLAQVESWIGANKQWTQKFTNDHIGRLKQSEERRGDTNALSYKQTFDFDRFGNMYRKAANNNPTGQENPLPYTPIEETDISKSTNRFTVETTYDDAGNVVTDDKFRSMSFGYDANGRMVKATKPNVPDALSVFDASGRRVAENVNDVWRFLIYDIGGRLIAEYGGLQATDEGGVKYVLQDWQGSPRAVVGNTGNVQSRSDYAAFGEQVDSSVGLRSSSQGFGKSGSLRQGYALTERDDATGLDHTWFRKHENQAGRWTSPDPYNGSMSLGDPQSFNRYSYVQSDPVNFVDPSGLLRIQECTRNWWTDSNGNRVYSSWQCVTIYDDGGVAGGGGGGANEAYDKFKEANEACAALAKKIGLDKHVAKAFFHYSNSPRMNRTFRDEGFRAKDVGADALDLPISAGAQGGGYAVSNYRNNNVFVYDRALNDNLFGTPEQNTISFGSTVFHEALHLKFNGAHEKIAKKLGIDYDKTSDDKATRDQNASEKIEEFIKNGCK